MHLERSDPHLRSMKEVRGYGIPPERRHRRRWTTSSSMKLSGASSLSAGGPFGVWIFGKEVLISPDWIDNVSWADLRVNVDVSREQVENSPGTAAADHRPRQRNVLYTHYGFPGYWV
ncbi:MAG: hypothetical protein R2856_10785 [Caldilineaceae bacterium]